MTPSQLQSHLHDLHTKGFTVIPNAIQQPLLEAAIRGYKQLCLHMQEQRIATLKENGRNARLANSHLLSPEISSLFLNEDFLALCDLFFGGRRGSIHSSLFYEEGSELPLHRDAPFVCTVPENLHLGCWFALEDSRIENGALMGVPYSNQTFIDEHQVRNEIGLERLKVTESLDFIDEMSCLNYQQYLLDKCGRLGLKAEAIEANAGDIVVWHPLFVHGGLPHKSTATRYSVVMFAVPENIQVHGSYLYFTPQKPLVPQKLEYVEIPGSTRYMRKGSVAFVPESRYEKCSGSLDIDINP